MRCEGDVRERMLATSTLLAEKASMMADQAGQQRARKWHINRLVIFSSAQSSIVLSASEPNRRQGILFRGVRQQPCPVSRRRAHRVKRG